MAIINCENCRKQYNDDPKFFKNGVAACPFCGYNPASGKPPVTPLKEKKQSKKSSFFSKPTVKTKWINGVEYPAEIKFPIGRIILFFIGLILLYMSIDILHNTSSLERQLLWDNSDWSTMIFGIIASVIIILLSLWLFYRDLPTFIARFKLFKNNNSEYQKLIEIETKGHRAAEKSFKDEIKAEMNRRDAANAARAKREVELDRIKNKPKCPTCGSLNVNKISFASKAIGVGAFGYFSKTARSQFEYKNCGYKW